MFRRLLATVSFLWLGAVFAVAQATLTTTFASNNGGSVGGAVHFDLTVLNPNGVVLSRFDVNCVNPRSTLARLEVWMTNLGGTHVGTQVNPAAGYWSRRAVATMVTAGQDLPTIAVLDQPIPLAAGTYGVALVHVGCAARYTGTATVPPTQTVFASADLRIDAGTAQNVPFSSGVFTSRIANTTVHYSVLSADTVAFSANVIRGPGPLLVQFRDRSVAAGTTITGWEWDLDGDGVTDSTLQDPFHAYASCGDYSVRLRITTPSGQTSLTWNQMIEVDPLEANFTMTPEVGAPPLVVQFTDTSRLTPLSWAWDFDGDGIADDVSPNPVWAFGPGCHAVTLTVANGCRSAQITRRVTATTDVLVAGGAPNSFVNETSVVFFDLSVTAAEVLSVAGIDFQSYTPAGNAMDCDVYLTESTYQGKLTSPAAWRKVATATGRTPAIGAPARLVLDRPILLLPGRSYGVGLHHRNNASHYINLQVPIGNADLTLTPGAVAFSPGGPFTNANPFQIRQWVGALHYLRASQWPQAGVTFFASGCAGALGVPTLVPDGLDRPLLGTSAGITLGNLEQGVGFLVLGFSATQGPLGPLPQDLGLFGAPGCNLHVSPDFSSLLLGVGTSATWSLVLPNAPALAGLRFFAQGLSLAPGSNALGGVTSDAAVIQVGAF